MPSVESDNTSLLFMIFASLVCSIPTPLCIRSIGVDLCSLDGLVPVGSSSKLFYFRKYFFEELEGRKRSSVIAKTAQVVWGPVSCMFSKLAEMGQVRD